MIRTLASNPEFPFPGRFPFVTFRKGLEISGKRTILRAITKFSIFSYQEFLLHLPSILELLSVSDGWFSFRNNFRIFQSLPEDVSVPFLLCSTSFASYTQISDNFLPRISALFDFHPGIASSFGWVVLISEQFSYFPEPFRRSFSTIFSSVQSSKNFWVNEKRLESPFWYSNLLSQSQGHDQQCMWLARH